jgi:hypothetical protein
LSDSISLRFMNKHPGPPVSERRLDTVPAAARGVPGPAGVGLQRRGRSGGVGLLLSTRAGVGPAATDRTRRTAAPPVRRPGHRGRRPINRYTINSGPR